MPGSRILFIGGASLELNMNMYKLPSAGESVTDDGGVAYIPSGRATLAASAAVKMGADSALLARLGADAHGHQLFSFLKESGVDTGFIKADRERPSGFNVIMKEADGSERCVCYPGANLDLSADSVTEAMDSMPDAVLISLEIPFSVATFAVRAANSRGIPVFVDGSPASVERPIEELPEVTGFIANTEEIHEYTGEMPAGATASLRAALALAKRVKARYYLIKQGARGTFIYDGKHYRVESALRLDKPKDVFGVGDVYAAALVLEFARSGFDINTAVRYATAATAVFVTREGALSSVPTDDEVMSVYNRNYS